MTILYVFKAFLLYGGVEKIIIDKMNYLVEKCGYDIYFVTYEQSGKPIHFFLSPKIHHINFDIPSYKEYRYGTIKRFFYHIKIRNLLYKRLYRLIKEKNIDIVGCTTYEYLTMEVLNKLRKRVSTVIETHVSKENVNSSELYKNDIIKKILYKWKRKKIYDFLCNASAFVTLTVSDAKEWNVHGNVKIIPNCLAYYPSKLDKSFSFWNHAISVGRLDDKQKGYDLLLRAWSLVYKRHPDFYLDIYGEGIQMENLLQLRSELGLDSVVRFYNPTTHIYDKYMESNFYIMSSRWEGFGLVLIEAMSCGIPCISFDCPHGPADIIKNGEDGILVENGNIEQLAEKICYLIENQDIKIKMGKKAHENVKRYLPERIMPMWMDLFESISKFGAT